MKDRKCHQAIFLNRDEISRLERRHRLLFPHGKIEQECCTQLLFFNSSSTNSISFSCYFVLCFLFLPVIATSGVCKCSLAVESCKAIFSSHHTLAIRRLLLVFIVILSIYLLSYFVLSLVPPAQCSVL
jgi:hypothetical protein